MDFIKKYFYLMLLSTLELLFSFRYFPANPNTFFLVWFGIGGVTLIFTFLNLGRRDPVIKSLVKSMSDDTEKEERDFAPLPKERLLSILVFMFANGIGFLITLLL